MNPIDQYVVVATKFPYPRGLATGQIHRLFMLVSPYSGERHIGVRQSFQGRDGRWYGGPRIEWITVDL